MRVNAHNSEEASTALTVLAEAAGMLCQITGGDGPSSTMALLNAAISQADASSKAATIDFLRAYADWIEAPAGIASALQTDRLNRAALALHDAMEIACERALSGQRPN